MRAMVRLQQYTLAVQAKLRVPNTVCTASDQRAKKAISLLIAVDRIIAQYHIDKLSALIRNQDPLNRASIIKYRNRHPVFIFEIITRNRSAGCGGSKRTGRNLHGNLLLLRFFFHYKSSKSNVKIAQHPQSW